MSDARHSANVRTGKVLPLRGPPPEPLPYWEAILGLFGKEAAAAAMCETGLTLFEASSSDRCTFSCSVGGSCWLVIVVGCGEALAAPSAVHSTVVSGWGACGCDGADVARLGPLFWRAPGGGGGAGGCCSGCSILVFSCSAMALRCFFDEGRVIIHARAL